MIGLAWLVRCVEEGVEEDRCLGLRARHQVPVKVERDLD